MIYNLSTQPIKEVPSIFRVMDEVRENISDHMDYLCFARLASCSKSYIGLTDLKEWTHGKSAQEVAKALIHLMASDMAEVDFETFLFAGLKMFDSASRQDLRSELLKGVVKLDHIYYLLKILSLDEHWSDATIADSFVAGCRTQSSKAVDILLEHPVTCRVARQSTHRLIHDYVEAGNVDGVQFLASRIRHSWHLGEALMSAIEHNHRPIIHLLMESGADINHMYGMPLKKACGMGNHHLVLQILNYGPNVNAREGEALGHAIWYRHIPIIKSLLKAGADTSLINVQFALQRKGNHQIRELVRPRFWVEKPSR